MRKRKQISYDIYALSDPLRNALWSMTHLSVAFSKVYQIFLPDSYKLGNYLYG